MKLLNSSIEKAINKFEDRKEGVVETKRDIDEVSAEDISELSNLRSAIGEDLEDEQSRSEKIRQISDNAIAAAIDALPDLEEVEDTPLFDALESGVNSVGESVETAALTSVKNAVSPLANNIAGQVEQQIFGLSGIATFFLDYQQQFMLAILKYLSSRIVKHLRILSNELKGIESIAADMVQAVELSLKAKELFSNTGNREPDIFNNVADRIQNAVNELEFKVAYTEFANADNFKDSSFLQNAINELDAAKELLPQTKSITERTQQAETLLSQAASVLQNASRRAVQMPNKLRQVATSYGECLFLGYLIRNMDTNVSSGMKMASIIGARQMLEDRIQELKKRRDSNREFANQTSTENEISQKSIYEHRKLTLLEAKLQGISSLISGSTSESYKEGYQQIFEAVNDPFFFGNGEALVDIELYARFITGFSRLDDRRNQAIVAYGETIIERVKELQAVIDQLVAEIQFRDPVSNPSNVVGGVVNSAIGVKEVTRVVRQMSSSIGVKEPMMAIATGKIATKVAKDVLNSNEEQPNTNSKTGEAAEGINEGRKYASDTVDASFRSDMVAMVRSQEEENSINEQNIAASISEAMKEHEQVNIIKQLRMSNQNI